MRGDAHFATVLTDASPALLGYFRRRAEPDACADLLAETMVTAWRRNSDLPSDPEQARMWLFGIARNVLLNAQRGDRRRWRLANSLRDVLHTTAPASDHGIDVRDAIARLPDELAELVRLVHWEGLTIGQAASVMDISASTARSRYQRAKAELRVALGVVV